LLTVTGFPLKAGFRVREHTEIGSTKSSKKCGVCHIIAKYHDPDPPDSPVMYRMRISQEVGNGRQVCGDVEYSPEVAFQNTMQDVTPDILHT